MWREPPATISRRSLTPLLVDPQGCEPLSQFYREFTGTTDRPADIEWACKHRVMEHELQAELDALSYRFADLARRESATCDLSRHALKRGLHGLRCGHADLPDYMSMKMALPRTTAGGNCGRTCRWRDGRDAALADDVMSFIEAVILGDERIGDRRAALDLAMRLQQLTGPVMAKGLEDTALYRFNRLIALNDVGERPEPFQASIADFHAVIAARAAAQPHSMLATSSHDSKRGEDTRARIATISGHAEAWIAAVPEWAEMLRRAGSAGDRARRCLCVLPDADRSLAGRDG